jgi:soluble lytic murein transglycosylase-like protein
MKWIVASVVLVLSSLPSQSAERPGIDAMIARHARHHGVPETLVHHVVKRESGYNPRLHSRGHWGLMQIKHETARGMGYRGPASGLLDPETNLTYAVPYLANAYRVARGNEGRAVSFYRRGYYYEAKRAGLLGSLGRASAGPLTSQDLAGPDEEASAAPDPVAADEASFPLLRLFRGVQEPDPRPAE